MLHTMVHWLRGAKVHGVPTFAVPRCTSSAASEHCFEAGAAMQADEALARIAAGAGEENLRVFFGAELTRGGRTEQPAIGDLAEQRLDDRQALGGVAGLDDRFSERE